MDDNKMGFDRTDKLLEHRNELAPENLLFQLTNDRFRDELGVLCSDLTNEETLLVIRTLEFSTPEDKNVPILFGKNIVRRSMLLRAEMLSHLAPLSVALSRVDPKHFGEWQCESILGAVSYDGDNLTPRFKWETELAMATWRGFDRRGNMTNPRINRAAGHLLLVASFGTVTHALGDTVSLDRTEDYEWFGANWERIVPLWEQMVAAKDFSREFVEGILVAQTPTEQTAA